MFEPVTKDIYRWTLTDPEFGEEIVGHLLMKDGEIVLVDPPATAKLIDSVRILGKPVAVIVTIYNHLRGCNHVARSLNVPLYIPETTVRGEERNDASLQKYGFPSGTTYGENTELPLGIRASRLYVEYPPGQLALDEMELIFGNFIIVGDSCWGIGGKLNIFPTGIFPDDGGKLADATSKVLGGIIRDTGVTGLLAGHGNDIGEGLQGMI